MLSNHITSLSKFANTVIKLNANNTIILNTVEITAIIVLTESSFLFE